jgi:Protein of unknown function (DUF3800)
MALDFQAFVDDSYTANGEFVLGGHIATAERWAALSKEWEALLPLGTLSNQGAYHFKMAEMAQTAERMNRVPAFYRVIENHVRLSISARMNLADFAAAADRCKKTLAAHNFQVDLAKWGNPYFFLFRGLIDEFHKSREDEGVDRHLPLDEKVDFIFDNQSEKGFIIYLKNEEGKKTRQYHGATPRFEDDKDFLPLQAADLWAWRVREWYEEEANDPPAKMANFDFGTWRGKKRSTLALSWSEQQIFDRLMEVAWQNFGSAHLVDGTPIFPDDDGTV